MTTATAAIIIIISDAVARTKVARRYMSLSNVFNDNLFVRTNVQIYRGLSTPRFCSIISPELDVLKAKFTVAAPRYNIVTYIGTYTVCYTIRNIII